MNSTAAVFATTHWSVVLAAGQSAHAQASVALEQLCRTYKEVQRLRHRYGELLREEIVRTVASPAGVEEELCHLFTVLSA
jgi:hypothetical protein